MATTEACQKSTDSGPEIYKQSVSNSHISVQFLKIIFILYFSFFWRLFILRFVDCFFINIAGWNWEALG